MPLTPGEILNERYRIEERLGQGGFGEVYKAWDLRLEGFCAVKRNLHLDAQFQRLFKQEAQMLFKLRHTGLPKVYDTFEGTNGEQYLVMEFIDGESLEHLVKRLGAIPVEQVLKWIQQICEALSYLHNRQPPIIHRDIKPANLILTPEGQVVLVDFGIAKAGDMQQMTMSGARGVTPGYSSLEQYSMSGTDAQSDVYSLAATTYTLLTGKVPADAMAVTMGEAEPTKPAHLLNPRVPINVSLVIETGMQSKRTERLRSVTTFLRALQEGAAPVVPQPMPEPESPSSDTIPQPPDRQPPDIPPSQPSPSVTSSKTVPARYNPVWIVGVVVILALLSGIVWLISYLTKNQGVLPVNSPVVSTTSSPDTATKNLVSDTPRLSLTFTWTPSASDTPSPILTKSPPASLTYTPTSLPDWIIDIYDVPMVLVPEGTFWIGLEADRAYQECQQLCIGCTCERDWFTDMQPVHQVYLDTFFIDKYEVTNARYAQCVEAGACQQPHANSSNTRFSYYNDPQYADYPVIFVDWKQAKTYCEWRGARLPTEAVWEKAARGTDNRLYPWGNTFDGMLANFCDKNCEFSHKNINYDDGYADTATVGSCPEGKSSYGAMDMAGNVWEWLADWYAVDYYASPSEWNNPTGPAIGDLRVVRGGAWHDDGDGLLSSNRNRYIPTNWYNNIGFRCARTP